MSQIFLNEESLSGQFTDSNAFDLALKVVIEAKGSAFRFNLPFYCNPLIRSKLAVGGATFDDVIRQCGNKEKTRVILSWISKSGPFWTSEQNHDVSDIYELNNEDVSGSSLAEAACRHSSGLNCVIFSFSPSVLAATPLVIEWMKNVGSSTIALNNYWDAACFDAFLQSAVPAIDNWPATFAWVRRRFDKIRFSDDAMDALFCAPFSYAVFEDINLLLKILNEISASHDTNGALTERGQELVTTYFQGHHSRFSDESANSKFDFRHPVSNLIVMCSWHGKIRHGLQYRIHFEWPKPLNELLWVSYIGPKLTKW